MLPMTSFSVPYSKSVPGADWQAYFPDNFEYTCTAGGPLLSSILYLLTCKSKQCCKSL